jgi:microcystin degradation protein MlrC
VIRVAVAGLWHETNTYSVRPTAIADYEAFELLAGAEILDRHADTRTVIGGMLADAAFDPVPTATGGAWPAGRVTAEALAILLRRLERELRAAGPLNGVLLDLHGAMVSERIDDVELEAARLVRSVVGEIPIAAVLDLHGNPSAEFVALCDAVIAYDSYPHVDMHERGREAARLMSTMLVGRRLRTLIRKLPLLTTPLAQATADAPMRELRSIAGRLATRAGIARISLLPGFPYSDVARAGFSVLVVHEDAAERAAAETAAALVAEVDARAAEFKLERPGPADAVRQALTARRRPVVLADVADNVGGGSPGDGTALLQQLLEQRAENAVVTIADREAVHEAAAAGLGGTVETAVGGKVDGRHGAPVRVRGRVLRLTDGRYRTSGTWMTGREFEMGRTAVVKAEEITLVLTERAVPPFHSEQLESVGIEPPDASIIVAKGAVAWRAAYEPIAGHVIEVDTPGICPLDPSVLPRTTTPIAV